MPPARTPSPRRRPPPARTQIRVLDSEVRIINGSYVVNEEHTLHYIGNTNNIDGVTLNTYDGPKPRNYNQPGNSLSPYRPAGRPVVPGPLRPGPNDAVFRQVYQDGSSSTAFEAFVNPDEMMIMGDETVDIFDAALDSAFGDESEVQWDGGNDSPNDDSARSTPRPHGGGDASFLSPSANGVTNHGLGHVLEFAADLPDIVPPPSLRPIPSSKTRRTTRTTTTTNSTSFTASYQTTPRLRDDHY